MKENRGAADLGEWKVEGSWEDWKEEGFIRMYKRRIKRKNIQGKK